VTGPNSITFASRIVRSGKPSGLKDEARGDRSYFSRSSAAVAGDLYVSEKQGDMTFGPAAAIVELNDAGANDIQPNVRKDGREIVFSSNRTGGQGGQDIWSATRASVDDTWSTPVNLGTSVNTSFGESRPSLSWDAQQLLFGRAGPVGTGEGGTGASDIYVATREQRHD
jgi:Tol biopolymer transport system component